MDDRSISSADMDLNQSKISELSLSDFDDDMEGEKVLQEDFKKSFGGRGGAPASAAPVPKSVSQSSKRLAGQLEVSKGTLKELKKGKQLLRRESRTRQLGGVDKYFFESADLGLEIDGVVAGDAPVQLYRRVEPTREWIENNYYELLPEAQNANLVKVNQFWKDYANHDGGTFASQWFAEANSNFTEMMFVLAVIDLPLRIYRSERRLHGDSGRWFERSSR